MYKNKAKNKDEELIFYERVILKLKKNKKNSKYLHKYINTYKFNALF